MDALTTTLVNLQNEGRREGLPLLGEEEAWFLSYLVREKQPRYAIDVGTMTGNAALLMAAAMPPRSRVLAIEISDELAGRADAHMRAAGLHWETGGAVRVARGDATDVLRAHRGPVDFVLLDAQRSQYLNYLKKIERWLPRFATLVAVGAGRHGHLMGPYLDYVRDSGKYASASRSFSGKGATPGDTWEISEYLGGLRSQG